MSGTIIDYLKKTKKVTFEMSPFNEVDSLILSQFSYLKFEGKVPGLGQRENAVTLSDIAALDSYDSLYEDERYRKNNMALFEGMVKSERFNKIKFHSYISIIDYDKESQFAAIVADLPDGTSYVAFRGTDENLVGWKEDFNMSLFKPIPGQIMSVDYLTDVAAYLPEYFRVGGHSKGGNLAVFSAMYCHESIKDRIYEIYNHDGPGFRNELMDEAGYQAIRGKIRMTVPHSSLIGMLLVNFDNYRVVESKMPGISGILQHDPYSWKVKGMDFVITDELSQMSAIKDRSINELVMGLDDAQINMFLDATNDIMEATGVNDLNELMANWRVVIKRVSNAMKEMDEETKDILVTIFQTLLEIADTNTRAEAEEKINEIKEALAEHKTRVEKIKNNLLKDKNEKK